MYLKRNLESELLKASKQFACITLYGPRQVGKSTIIDHLFGTKFIKVSLDDLSIRDYALKDPRGFLDFYAQPLIIDEIQKAPDLLSYIKIIIDEYKLQCLKENKQVELIYILTGSNQFELQEAICESLAGRTAIFNMASLSFGEIYGYQDGGTFIPNLDVLKEKEKKNHLYRSRLQIFEDIFKGGMPEFVTTSLNREIFFKSYLETYIEKDVKKVISASKETTFLVFMQYLALRTGNQIDYTDISRNVGIDVRTVKEWISILQTSGIIEILHPYMANISSSIVKTPKLYFMDTGLGAYLARIPNAEILEKSAFAGAFYETYVVSEIIKSYSSSSRNYQMELYYYRDKNQKEVDLIFDTFEGIIPLEIKKGINPVSYNKNFKFLEKYHRPILKGLVVDSCKHLSPINDQVFYCPISLIGL
jgi:hypothetical protein